MICRLARLAIIIPVAVTVAVTATSVLLPIKVAIRLIAKKKE